MEEQRQATENQATNQREPLALFQPALLDEQRAINQYRGADQYCGGAENAAYHKGMARQIDRTRVHFENDEKQQQRDEIDELFHSGSQKQDVAA